MSNQTDKKEWRCFHCDEVFRDVTEARLHFGSSPHSATACEFDVAALRTLQEQLRRYQEEDTDLERQIRNMECQHQQALLRAEEAGYDKGLKDGRLLAAQESFRH